MGNTGARSNKPPKTRTSQDVKKLAGKLGVSVSDSFVSSLGADFAYSQISAMDELFSAFGVEMNKHISTISTAKMGENTYGYSHSGVKGGLTFNPSYYSDTDKFKATYERDVKTHYHPYGTTYETVAVHEAGHRLSQALTAKFHKTGVLPTGEKIPSGFQRTTEMWKDSPTNRLIVLAKRNAKKQTGLSVGDLVNGISRYAKKNNQETYAEAMADWYVNRESAQPLSLEIVRLTKEYLNG